jgi:uncharacterized protein
VPECGARLSDDPDHAHEAPIDPRWAALRTLDPVADPDPDTDGTDGATEPVASGRDDE